MRDKSSCERPPRSFLACRPIIFFRLDPAAFTAALGAHILMVIFIQQSLRDLMQITHARIGRVTDIVPCVRSQ